MKFFFAVAAIAALAAACGGGGGGGGESSLAAGSPTAERAATEAATPGTFSPQATPTSTVAAEPTQEPFEGSTDPVVKSINFDRIVTLIDVRAAAHDGFDRIVFEFEGDEVPGYQIRYLGIANACGSGELVGMSWPALLHINLALATAHTDSGESTVDFLEINLDSSAITKAEFTCDFEAIVNWAVKATGTLPFNVFELSEPARLVIDIAHP